MEEFKSGKYQVIDKDSRVVANITCSEKVALRVGEMMGDYRILREDGKEVKR